MKSLFPVFSTFSGSICWPSQHAQGWIAGISHCWIAANLFILISSCKSLLNLTILAKAKFTCQCCIYGAKTTWLSLIIIPGPCWFCDWLVEGQNFELFFHLQTSAGPVLSRTDSSGGGICHLDARHDGSWLETAQGDTGCHQLLPWPGNARAPLLWGGCWTPDLLPQYNLCLYVTKSVVATTIELIPQQKATLSHSLTVTWIV